MGQQGLAVHAERYMVAGAFLATFLSFFLILICNSATGSAGTLSLLCHLLIPCAHSMFGSDLLWQFSHFIPVGCLIS